MSDENKGKPSKSVMGNLPSTRPTRMAPPPRRRARRQRHAPSRPAAASKPAKPKAAAAKAKPKAAAAKAKPKAAAGKAKPKAAARPKPPPRRRRQRPRAVRSGSPSLDAAKKSEADPAPRARAGPAEGRRARDHRGPGDRRAGQDRPHPRRPGAQARRGPPPEAVAGGFPRRTPRARFPRAESPRAHRGERGTHCGLRATGANRTHQTSVALLSLREPVSSPRRHRRKHR